MQTNFDLSDLKYSTMNGEGERELQNALLQEPDNIQSKQLETQPDATIKFDLTYKELETQPDATIKFDLT